MFHPSNIQYTVRVCYAGVIDLWTREMLFDDADALSWGTQFAAGGGRTRSGWSELGGCP